ncbi:MAG: DUF1449 family protein [Mariprofundales bacterium]
MDNFLVNISSFPTAIYTTSLVVVVGYWLLAFSGTFDLNTFDLDLDLDVDVDVDLDVDGDISNIGGIAGLLTTLGLTGVPITIVISLLLLNSWIICYFLSLLVPTLPQFISLVQIAINIGVTIVSFMGSLLITVIMIKPLRGLFRKVNQAPKSKSLLGSSCRIRSSRADADFGEAECHYEGASLIIKVRASEDETFATGDMVVVIEHDNTNDFFNVVSEKDFKRQLELG